MMKKRLSVNIPLPIHEHITTVCIKRNITISRWVLRALVEKLIRDRDINHK